MAQQPQNSNQQGNGGAPLIKPAQVDGLPHLDQDAKQRYKNGLQQLWQALEANAPGSQKHVDAQNKIRAASVQIMQQISKVNRPAPGMGGGPGGGQPGGGQQRPPTQGQQGQGGGQNGMVQGMQQGQQQQGGGQQQGQQGQAQQQQLSQVSRQEIQSIKINIPPQVVAQGEQAANNYRRSWQNRAMQMLTRRDTARGRGSNLQKMTQSGQGNQQQLLADMEKLKAEMHAAHQEWEQLKANNLRMGQNVANGMGQQQPVSQPQQGQGQDMTPRTGSAGGIQGQSQQPQAQVQAQAQQQDVKMNMDQQARTSTSPTQQQAAFSQQQQQNPNAPSSAHSNMPQQQPMAHPQQTPQSATQPNYPQQNNMPQQMGQQPQQRPPMTAQQMALAQQNMAPQRQGQGMPQNAGQAQQPQQPQHAQAPQPQRPQPLTHQAAMSQASYARQDAAQQQGQQQAQQQPQMQQNIPHGLPLNTNPPQSATNQTPTSAYPQMPNEHRASTTKFPIPKTLHLGERTQGPVQGPPSRPTYSNAGMMGQPGVQRQAQFTLEGEGDRVLSKRKLDELVRQVTGSTADGGGLTPEVEESVLTLADDFVDNVITSACRLAKMRNSQTLDIRDLQIVLERNYGIRIPGYGLDEVRTVRKFQPAEGWRSKMQAVQAGKVMNQAGGKDV